MDIEQFLKDASINAVEHTATIKAYHAQLELLDRKTNIICLRFLSEVKLEPIEREHMAEQLVLFQRCRAAVVKKIMELSLNI